MTKRRRITGKERDEILKDTFALMAKHNVSIWTLATLVAANKKEEER